MKPARVELGVGDGDSVAGLLAFDGGPVWAYDTFDSSFPVHTCWDDEDTRLCQDIGGVCNQLVLARLVAMGITCVVGEFPASFWRSHPESVSMVRVDMDTYVATIAALELFHPLMVPGGHFLVHDHNNGRLLGVRRAIKQFLDSPTGQLYRSEEVNGHMRITRCL